MDLIAHAFGPEQSVASSNAVDFMAHPHANTL